MRKIVLFVLSALFGAAAVIPFAPARAEVPERFVMSDSYIQVSVHSGSGRFSARTTGGDPWAPNDTNRPILYEDEMPETSYTTFRIGGEEVIFGNRYGPFGIDGGFVQEPQQLGNKTVAVWRYKDVYITQTIQIIPESGDISVGNALITYDVENRGARKVEVGARILLDTMTGDNDGAPIVKAGEYEPVPGEREFVGAQVPIYWSSSDDFENPTVTTYGILYGWGDEKPDRVVFGHWASLSSSKWEYTPDGWLDYASDDNVYGAADSAVAVYFNGREVAPEGRTRFATVVGMGSIQEKERLGPGENFLITVNAPKKLTFSPGFPEPFEVTMELSNTNVNGWMRGASVEIAYPDDLMMIEGDKGLLFGDVGPGQKRAVTWKFRPSGTADLKVYDFTIQVNYNNKKKLKKVYVVGMKDFRQAPEVQYSLLEPTTLYSNDRTRTVLLRGKNLDYFRDNPNQWRIYLKADNGREYDVAKSSVTVRKAGTEMLFDLPDGLPLGEYGLGIEHELTNGYFKERVLTISDDPKYKRYHGTLLITKTVRHIEYFGKTYEEITHHIHLFKSGAGVEVPEQEEEVLRLTGDIQIINDENGNPEKYLLIPDVKFPVYLGGNLLKIVGGRAFEAIDLKEEGEASGEDDTSGKMFVELRTEPLYSSESVPARLGTHTYAHVIGGKHLQIYLNANVKMDSGIPLSGLIWSREFDLDVNKMELKSPRLLRDL